MARNQILVDRLTIIRTLTILKIESLRCAGLPDSDPWPAQLREVRDELIAALGVEYAHLREAEQVQRGEMAADEATVRIKVPPPPTLPRPVYRREDQEPARPGHTRAHALACGKLVGGPWLVLVLVLALVLWLVGIGAALCLL